MLVVTLIKFIHLIIVMAVVGSVFIPSCWLKKIVFVFLIYLLFQFATGWKTCGLTEIEYLILGEERHKEGFMYRLIKPIVTIPEKYFYYGIFVFHLLWISILFYQLRTMNCEILGIYV